jgi:DNA polymerase III alpha subunit
MAEYKSRNMLDLLRWLKYFVDTCEKEGVVWGIGRGSSVASYILYLIGVHSVDSIKYNLDWQEFLR